MDFLDMEQTIENILIYSAAILLCIIVVIIYLRKKNRASKLVKETLTGTYLESAYMNGKIYGADISKDLFQGKFQTAIGYRYIDYILPESKLNVLQNVGNMSIFWLFSKKMSFSANYEGT
jgi:hypothetical protein